MKNEQVRDQHPENNKSLFQSRVPNQLNKAQDKGSESRVCPLCNASEPTNVSSGPDWAKCDGCASLTHLRCFRRASYCSNASDPASLSSLPVIAAAGQAQAQSKQILCHSCLASMYEIVSDARDGPQDSPTCSICRQSDQKLVSLVQYTIERQRFAKQVYPKEEISSKIQLNNEQCFVEQVAEVFRTSDPQIKAQMYTLMLHARCVGQAIGSENLSNRNLDADDLLSEQFWQQLQQKITQNNGLLQQLPLVQAATSSMLRANDQISETLNEPKHSSQGSDLRCLNCDEQADPFERNFFNQTRLEEIDQFALKQEKDALSEQVNGHPVIEMIDANTLIQAAQFECNKCSRMQKQKKQGISKSQINDKKVKKSDKQLKQSNNDKKNQHQSHSILDMMKFRSNSDSASNLSKGLAADQDENQHSKLLELASVGDAQNSEMTPALKVQEIVVPSSNLVDNSTCRISQKSKTNERQPSNRDSQGRIVHRISNRKSSSFSQNQPQNNTLAKNEFQQATLAQSTLVLTQKAETNSNQATLELGKRQRRPPIKGYEQFLDSEDSKVSKQSQVNNNKRSRTEQTSGNGGGNNVGDSGIESNSVQPQLSQFLNNAAEKQQSTISFEGQQIKLNLTDHDKISKEQAEAAAAKANQEKNEKKLMQQDPFQNPFINDVFKPIMAADKLQVLRKDKERFDIFILPKDLKVFNKDKRDAFLANYNEEEDAALLQEVEILDEELDDTIQDDQETIYDIDDRQGAGSNTEPRAITQQSSVDQDQMATCSKSKPKRRKKASNLSRQANRRTKPGAELSWICNLAKNRKLQDEMQLAYSRQQTITSVIFNQVVEESGQNNKSHSQKKSQLSSKTDSFKNDVAESAAQEPLLDNGEDKLMTMEKEPYDLINQLKKEIQNKEFGLHPKTTTPLSFFEKEMSQEDGQKNIKNNNSQSDILMQDQENQNDDQNQQPNDSNISKLLSEPLGNCLKQLESNQNGELLKDDKLDFDLKDDEPMHQPAEESKGQIDPFLPNFVKPVKDQNANAVKDDMEQDVIRKQEDEGFKYKDRSFIQTVDNLYNQYNMGYYHRLETLQDDFRYLVEKVIRTRCKNQLAKDYLNKVLVAAVTHLDRKKNDFNAKWRTFYDNKFRENKEFNPSVSYEWQKYAGAKRQYFTIDDYKVLTTKEMGKLPDTINPQTVSSLDTNGNSDEYQEVIKKMQTTKKTKCGSDCPCSNQKAELKLKFSQQELPGTMPIEEKVESQQSGSNVIKVEEQLCCFHRRVECGKDCGCDPKQCRNRQMTLKQQLLQGQDVEERTAWGMDMYTAVNLFTLRPRDIPYVLYSEFLEYRLMFAVQQQREDGYDIRKALEFIIASEPIYHMTGPEADNALTADQLQLWAYQDDPLQFSFMEKQLAKVILEAIINLKGQNDPHFRIHSKGLGIFCKKKGGIQKNSLLVEYFGEIYPQWLWYEKQDVLKQGQTKGNLSKDLPDFYNITYERHYDDPAGYDVLTVDPILFGNYASRLSHSCNPNCETITKIKQDAGLYSIGMFTQKNIKFGEELCFNYCSFTESEEEYRSAACLCGSMICSGRFLNLAVAQKNQGLMKEYHTFVDRNMILYKAIDACSPEGEGITLEDRERLDKFGIRDSVLSGVPDWLTKWAALICEFVEFEQEKYPEAQAGKLSDVDIAIELKNLRDSKISNIAITINKVTRILKIMGTELPPIRKMTDFEIYNALWGASDSLKHQLVEVLSTIERCDEVLHCFELISTADQENFSFKKDDLAIDGTSIQEEKTINYNEKCDQIRDIFDFISQTLRGLDSKKVAVPALCDNLILYAKTMTYFTPNDYQKCTGKEVHIRKCDVAGQASDQKEFELAIRDQGKTVYKGIKEYQAHHIWGQLVGWFKQTVDKPNSSLSADRRGSLSMPDISSFIVSAKNQDELHTSGKASQKKKRQRWDMEDYDGEVMPSMGSSSRRNANRKIAATSGSAGGTSSRAKYDQDGIYIVPQGKTIKITYPHQKYQTREAFLENWESFFSKNWNTCCHWSFKNKHKLYGSIGLESVLKAGKDRTKRLQYFREVVDGLKGYQA